MGLQKVFSLVIALHALKAVRSQDVTQGITWGPCNLNPNATASIPLTCGTLAVPLDYTNPDSTTLNLNLVKVDAVKQPARSSILFNPGGPGASGREYVAGSAEELLLGTGGEFDLIGFDPRGTSDTIPFSCFSDSESRTAYNLKSPGALNSSDTAYGLFEASTKTLLESCEQNAQDNGELIGTGFVARDMMRIVDALDEDGLLRYWGASYGTVLGATVAAMYPERMDKLVLDGVVNLYDYYSGLGLEQIKDSDAVLDGFFKGCMASPDSCSLAYLATSAADLKGKYLELLNTLKYQPMAIGPNAATDIIDETTIKEKVAKTLYTPVEWIDLATGLHGLFTDNTTEAAELNQPPPPQFFTTSFSETILGIRGGDVVKGVHDSTAVQAFIQESLATSQVLGDSLPLQEIIFNQWPFQAKGAYTGDFHVKTRNPILIVSSQYDPITPLASAYNASAAFEGSVVLEALTYGHCATAQPSLCTAKAIRDYFVNGALPAPGTSCPASVELFSSPKDFKDAHAPLLNITTRALEFDDGDEALLNAMRSLSTKMPHYAHGF